MKIARVEEAFEKCRNHLTQTNSFSTEVETFLTQHLLVLICASFEEEIEQIIAERANATKDPHIASFCRSCVAKGFRNPKTSDIAGLLGRFGEDYKRIFQSNVTGTKEETNFNNIVNNRHKVAHESGVNVTYTELEKFYREGVTILDKFKEALFA